MFPSVKSHCTSEYDSRFLQRASGDKSASVSRDERQKSEKNQARSQQVASVWEQQEPLSAGASCGARLSPLFAVCLARDMRNEFADPFQLLIRVVGSLTRERNSVLYHHRSLFKLESGGETVSHSIFLFPRKERFSWDTCCTLTL
jgi:hypothetical protein